jgi:glycolate oxidase FAD binding subunit
MLLAILDSRLAPTAMQLRLGASTEPVADVLIEGTDAGLASLEASIRDLAGTARVANADSGVWAARQEIWSQPEGAIAKLSVLPSDIARTVSTIANVAATGPTNWTAVVQATGAGWLHLDGDIPELPAMLRELRAEIEREGGSFVVLRQPPGATPLDAWGNPGDALPLMRALKQQLDPRGTLNPGRFVGGI